MHSSIRNMSIARTTQPTQKAPLTDRLIQAVSFLSVSSNQTVTQAEVALATNPYSKDDSGLSSTDLLLELAHQIALQSRRLQFKQTPVHPLHSTHIDLHLGRHPMLDENVPMSLTCTTTYLAFGADNSPTRIAVDVEISQGDHVCCRVEFTQVSEDAFKQSLRRHSTSFTPAPMPVRGTG